jgi:formate dehydrogenase subunit gamma
MIVSTSTLTAKASEDRVVDDVVASLRDEPGALLPVLHAVYEQLGTISNNAIDRIARGLNLSRAEVYGVVTFYHDFSTAPRTRHLLKLCRAEACQAMGSQALEDHLLHRHGLKIGEHTNDRRLAVKDVYCLGLCACGPAAMLDGEAHARVDVAGLDRLIASTQEGEQVP